MLDQRSRKRPSRALGLELELQDRLRPVGRPPMATKEGVQPPHAMERVIAHKPRKLIMRGRARLTHCAQVEIRSAVIDAIKTASIKALRAAWRIDGPRKELDAKRLALPLISARWEHLMQALLEEFAHPPFFGHERIEAAFPLAVAGCAHALDRRLGAVDAILTINKDASRDKEPKPKQRRPRSRRTPPPAHPATGHDTIPPKKTIHDPAIGPVFLRVNPQRRTLTHAATTASSRAIL